MSFYYFFDPKQKGDTKIYEMSVTTDINISAPAITTKSPVEDGSSIIDNYYIDNKVITFSGILTNILVLGDQERMEPSTWISDLEDLRGSKVLLTLVAAPETIPNVLITDFTLSKNKDQGLFGWKCNLTFQEVDISERAKIVEIKEPKKEVSDTVTKKSKGSDSNTKGLKLLGTTSSLDVANAISATPVGNISKKSNVGG